MTHRISVGFALLLGLAVVGCKDLPVTCGIPDDTQECECSDGRTGGEQTCRNNEWTECKCPGEPIPADAMIDSATDGSAATSGSGGTGAVDGGAGTGGTGAVDGGSGTGGTGAVDGGSGTGGTGGTGAVDGGSGTGGTGGSFPAAYTGPCDMDDDCGPDAVCVKNAAMSKNHCAPECTVATSCPDAPPGGNAVKDCATASLGGPTVCRLSCFGATCPTTMVCEGIVPAYCF